MIFFQQVRTGFNRAPSSAKCVFRNPICKHSYERESLAYLLSHPDAVCPMVGCTNDHALQRTELVFAVEPEIR